MSNATIATLSNGPSTTATKPAGDALVITRVFKAPRRLVFAAWTKPEHLRRWCAPKDFTIPESDGQARVGGGWRTHMVSPAGTHHICSGVYREIVDGERIVFTHAWDNTEGKRGHETTVTVTFADSGPDATLMTFRQENFKSPESRAGHGTGWTEAFENLANYIESTATSNRNP